MTRQTAPGRPGRWLRIAVPVVLAALTAVHPGYSTDAAHEADRIAGASAWLPLHLALLLAFAGYAVSLLTWPTAGGKWWSVRRAAVLVSLVYYSAFVGVDGIAGGLIAEAGLHASPAARPGLAAAVATLFSTDAVRSLALIGAAGWVLATLAVTVELASDSRLLPAGGLLVASGLVLAFSHDPPVGPFGAGLALLAGVLLDLVPALSARSRSVPVRG